MEDIKPTELQTAADIPDSNGHDRSALEISASTKQIRARLQAGLADDPDATERFSQANEVADLAKQDIANCDDDLPETPSAERPTSNLDAIAYLADDFEYDSTAESAIHMRPASLPSESANLVVPKFDFLQRAGEKACDKKLDEIIDVGISKGKDWQDIVNAAVVDSYENCRPKPRSREWITARVMQMLHTKKPAAAGSSVLSSTKRKNETRDELHKRNENAPGDLMDGLLPAKSANILFGDSGLGKTAFQCQKALCFAAGIPFLGRVSVKGVSLYVDYENGSEGLAKLIDTLTHFLELAKTPDTFRVLHHPGSINEVIGEIRLLRAEFPELPIYVVVDALRGFDPSAESKNDKAGALITKLQGLAEELNFALEFVHHNKKEDEHDPLPSLEDTDIMVYANRASGAKGLINQTNVRVAIDKTARKDADLVIKGHHKLRGSFGPIWIARIYDDTGEPVGYCQLTGVDLLPVDQQLVFKQLPDDFSFTQVEQQSGKGRNRRRLVAELAERGSCREDRQSQIQ